MLESLLQSPKLPLYARQLQQYMDEERHRREAFYDFEEYAASGIREYWIIDPAQQTVEQYILHDAEYALLLKLKAGDISSEVVTGFTIPVAAIFDRKLKNQVLTQLLNR